MAKLIALLTGCAISLWAGDLFYNFVFYGNTFRHLEMLKDQTAALVMVGLAAWLSGWSHSHDA